MLPPFDHRGYLPPGIHRCSIDELAEHFGQGSPERQVEMAELRELVTWCREFGSCRVLVNGSFTTVKRSPNDVDVVVLLGPDQKAEAELGLADPTRWPFLHITVALDEDDFVAWSELRFGTDRLNCPKGVVEVLP